MKHGIIQYMVSCGLVAVLVWILSFRPDSPAVILMAPGMLLADVVFAQGVHSNNATA